MFEPNVHSQWQIGWRDITPEVFVEVEQAVRQHYGVTSVRAVEQVDEWEQSSNNYRVAGETAEGSSQILVRRNIISRFEDVQASTRVMEHLRQSGTIVPRVIPAVDGSSIVRFNNTDWQAFEFIAGDHFSGDENQLAQAAAGVAEVHLALTFFPNKELVASVDIIVGSLRVDYWNDAVQVTGQNPFELMLLERYPFIQEKVRQTAEALSAIQQQAEVIHGDIHPQNFLFQNGTLAAILDFGNMALADQMNDVAMACHRLVRQYIVHQGRPWEEILSNGVRLFLSSYTAVNPLSDLQVRLLPAFADALLLRKMAHNFRLYREGRRTWEESLSQFDRFFGFIEGEVEAIRTVI